MIIHPMFFYLLQIFHNVRIFGLIIGILFPFTGACMLVVSAETDNKTASRVFANLSKTLFVVGVVAFIIAIFLPSRETMLMMQAAKFTTVENVELIGEALKATLEYVATLF